MGLGAEERLGVLRLQPFFLVAHSVQARPDMREMHLSLNWVQFWHGFQFVMVWGVLVARPVVFTGAMAMGS